MNSPLSNADSRRRLWPIALVWLFFLAPYFFLTYGQVNQFTATRNDVTTLVYSWESAIPFWPWTIVPYWSIDLLYGISLFICTTRRELMIHGYRLALASLVACAGFLMFPLRFSFVRPISDGPFGWLFAQLEMFDLPYNQAPSLHIILLWLLWLRFYPHVASKWRWLLHGWFALIGLSVLTTWQHHFIDIVTGLFAGVAVSYALPMASNWRWQPSEDPFAKRLASYYFTATIILVIATCLLGGGFWLIMWPAAALFMIALGYLGLGSGIFQKSVSGRISPSARILLAPYQLGAWCSFLYFSKKNVRISEIVPGIFLGSYPRSALPVVAVLDMTSEWSRSRYAANLSYLACPQLDLLAPDIHELENAVQALNRLQPRGPVLVHCALGLSRSAIVVAAWLIQRGYASNADDAINIIRNTRAGVIFRSSHIHILNRWVNQYSKETEYVG